MADIRNISKKKKKLSFPRKRFRMAGHPSEREPTLCPTDKKKLTSGPDCCSDEKVYIFAQTSFPSCHVIKQNPSRFIWIMPYAIAFRLQQNWRNAEKT